MMNRYAKLRKYGLMLFTVLAVITPSESQAEPACTPPPVGAGSGATVGFARVFRRGGSGTDWAVCDVRVGRVVPIMSFVGSFDEITTAGLYFAYVSEPDDFGRSFDIASINLETGQYAHHIHFRPSRGAVGSLVAKTSGSIAWIQYQTLNLDSSDPVTVRLADRRGVRVPKNGYHVKARSLRLRGSLLTWTRGRKRYSARLH